MQNKYMHDEKLHNSKSPMTIVGELLSLIPKPNSVVDFGCGIGTFVRAFKNVGVKDVLGLDGKWVDEDLLYKYIKPSEFKKVNLEKKVKLDKKYDLAISLEVAEHLMEIGSYILITKAKGITVTFLPRLMEKIQSA